MWIRGEKGEDENIGNMKYYALVMMYSVKFYAGARLMVTIPFIVTDISKVHVGIFIHRAWNPRLMIPRSEVERTTQI